MSRAQLIRAEQIYMKTGQTAGSLRRLAAYWAGVAHGYRRQERFEEAAAADKHAAHYTTLADIHTDPDPEPQGGKRAA